MIISQWSCDNCGKQAQTGREGPSTPMGLYIPKAYLRTPADEEKDELKDTSDFWFCEVCTDLSDDLVGAVILTKLRGLKALRSVTTHHEGEEQ